MLQSSPTIALPMGSTLTSVLTPQSFCRFGIARCDITPPVGIYHRMWGAATHERATGVHRPLSATAIAFQALDETKNELSRIIVVAVDHCLLHAKEMDSLLHSVAARCKLPPHQLVVTFSHTHSAGLMGLDRSNLPGGELIPAYLMQLAESIASIVSAAVTNTQPATICYGIARSDLAENRDFWDEETQQLVCGFNQGGL